MSLCVCVCMCVCVSVYESVMRCDWLFFQATQIDNESRYGVAMLVITVAGQNSNAPQFIRDDYIVHVSELLPIGTVIVYVSATDIDMVSTLLYPGRQLDY